LQLQLERELGPSSWQGLPHPNLEVVKSTAVPTRKLELELRQKERPELQLPYPQPLAPLSSTLPPSCGNLELQVLLVVHNRERPEEALNMLPLQLSMWQHPPKVQDLQLSWVVRHRVRLEEVQDLQLPHPVL